MKAAALFALAAVLLLGVTDWPGSTPETADRAGALGGNISGLTDAGPDGLWAVRDAPSELLKLERRPDGWAVAGGTDGVRPLRFVGGAGSPDAEAVATGPDGVVYVAAERDNDVPGTSRNTILEYPTADTGVLFASREWSLDDVLPDVDANRGIEALEWLPPGVVSETGLLDAAGATDLPPGYARTDGLFVVGLEDAGELLVLALGNDATVRVVAFVSTGLDGVMDLAWHEHLGELWALCDATCGSQIAVLSPSPGGFVVDGNVRLPAAIEALDLEGLALGPGCESGGTAVIWSDDSATGGHAIHEASFPCDQNPSEETDAVQSERDVFVDADEEPQADPTVPEPVADDDDGVGGALLLGVAGLAAVATLVGISLRRNRNARGVSAD